MTFIQCSTRSKAALLFPHDRNMQQAARSVVSLAGDRSVAPIRPQIKVADIKATDPDMFRGYARMGRPRALTLVSLFLLALVARAQAPKETGTVTVQVFSSFGNPLSQVGERVDVEMISRAEG